MKCLSIESRIITCSSVSAAVDSLLLALSPCLPMYISPGDEFYTSKDT